MDLRKSPSSIDAGGCSLCRRACTRSGRRPPPPDRAGRGWRPAPRRPASAWHPCASPRPRARWSKRLVSMASSQIEAARPRVLRVGSNQYNTSGDGINFTEHPPMLGRPRLARLAEQGFLPGGGDASLVEHDTTPADRPGSYRCCESAAILALRSPAASPTRVQRERCEPGRAGATQSPAGTPNDTGQLTPVEWTGQ